MNSHHHHHHPHHHRGVKGQYVTEERLQRTLVVTCVSNPILYESRYRLYRDFEKYMTFSGANLFTVELATGDREFAVTEAGNPRHTQLRSVDDFWHKENMQMLAVQRASANPEFANWENVLFIDADVAFADPHWLVHAWHELQRHHIVQLFSQAIDLTPNFTMFQKHRGFVSCYVESGFKTPDSKLYESWHPGFAWGMTRHAYETLGGLIDFSIGAGDRQMALAFIGAMREGDQCIPAGISAGYKEMLLEYQERAYHLRRDISYLKGTVLHYWHGKKAGRQYKSRPRIWIDNKYNPRTDLRRDSQGLWQINDVCPRRIRLRDDIRQYFIVRNEDDITLG